MNRKAYLQVGVLTLIWGGADLVILKRQACNDGMIGRKHRI